MCMLYICMVSCSQRGWHIIFYIRAIQFQSDWWLCDSWCFTSRGYSCKCNVPCEPHAPHAAVCLDAHPIALHIPCLHCVAVLLHPVLRCPQPLHCTPPATAASHASSLRHAPKHHPAALCTHPLLFPWPHSTPAALSAQASQNVGSPSTAPWCTVVSRGAGQEGKMEKGVITWITRNLKVSYW